MRTVRMPRPSGALIDGKNNPFDVPLVESVSEDSIEVDVVSWRANKGLYLASERTPWQDGRLFVPTELLETFLVAVPPQGIQGWYTLDVEMPLVRLYLTPENAAAALGAYRFGAGRSTP